MAANGSRIPNLGQMVVAFENSLGAAGEILFQVAQITKPLVNISKLIDDGHQVVFDQRASYIVHKETGKKMMLRREGGVFIIDALVELVRKPKTVKKDIGMGFNRRG